MTSEQKRKIEQLRKTGHGYASIADVLGLSKSQVSAYCRRAGLSGTKADAGVADVPAVACCRNCGKALVQPVGKKTIKFCSDACRTHWWNTHPDAVNKKAFYDFTCAGCGKPFRAYGNAHRKYCNHKCYTKARFQGGDGRD